MYASTASITNNGIQLTLEQALAPGGSSSTSGGSTSSTGTASSGDGQPLANSKVGTPNHHGAAASAAGQLNNAFYLNNLRNPLPPPYVNNQLTVPSSTNQVAGRYNASANGVALNHHQSPPVPASLPASVRATPTADFELYPRHLRTHSYTQATQPHHHHQIHNPVHQNSTHQQAHHRDSRVPLSTPSYRRNPPVVQQYQLRQLNTPNILSDPGLYDKIHGRQSSSSAGS